ncbi:hypothetical protein [Clostridium sp. KNHs216]|uniref:hypothetical protein n=1 Tax=Clostridium sp. KNHs216 TaxID=1550235 RepID=UPI00114D605B|nr:hypothetical protein [Clostridium sp. KNHs216]
MEKRDRIRRMAIITESGCWKGVGRDEGKSTLFFEMVYISGSEKGKAIEKRYVFEEGLPDSLCKDMLRMGFMVKSFEDIESIAGLLVGIVVRVSLVQDGDTLRIYVDDYFGRDDPKKYAVNR